MRNKLFIKRVKPNKYEELITIKELEDIGTIVRESR